MIHRKIYSCLLIALCAVVVLPVVADARSISETVEQAVNSSPDVYAAYAAQTGREGVVKETKSGFFPVFSADANVKAMRIDDNFTRGSTSNSAESGYAGEGSVRVSQMVYDGQNTSNIYKAAQNRLEASKFEANSKSGDVALASVASHLNVLRMRELEFITTTYLKDISKYERLIKSLVDNGASNEAELLQAYEAKAIVQNALLNYQEQIQLAEAEYLQVVGEWPEDKITIADSDIAAGKSVPTSIEDALVMVRTKHPTLRSAEHMLDALGYDIKAANSYRLPRLDAEVSYLKMDRKESFAGEREDATALLRMSWNFEIGGAQKARVMQRRQDREEARLRMRSIERELEKKLRQAMARYNVSMDRLKLQDKRRKTNADILQNYKNQFEGGKRSLLEVINIGNQSYQASVEYTNAYYGYYMKQFEFLNAVGMLQDALGVKIYKTARQ